MAQYSKEYFAEGQRLRRAIAKEIYTKHAWQKMDGESDKDFRRRFTKRIIVVVDDKKIIQDPFGKILYVEENKSEHTQI